MIIYNMGNLLYGKTIKESNKGLHLLNQTQIANSIIKYNKDFLN